MASTFDKLLHAHIGEFGKLQLITLLVIIPTGLLAGLNTMEIIFMAEIPQYSCFADGFDNDSMALAARFIPEEQSPPPVEFERVPSIDACNVYNSNITRDFPQMTNISSQLWTEEELSTYYLKPCLQWTYNESIHGRSIVSQWDLVCDRAGLIGPAKSVHLFGQFLGNLIGGILSDKFGRLPVGRATLIISCIMRLIMTFNPIFPVFLTARLISGGADCLVYCNFVIICSELLSPSKRPWSFAFASAGFLIGFLLASLNGYLLPNWTDMTLANTIISTLLCVPALFLPESPRWLYSVGKHRKGAEILQWMAKVNGNNSPKEECFDDNDDDGHFKTSGPEWKASIRSSLFIVRLFSLGFLWFCVSLIYYGIAFNVGSLQGNVYINSAILSAMDLPGYLFISHIVNSCLGRRYTLILTFLLCSISLYGDMALGRESIGRTILAIVGKLAVSTAFVGIVLTTPEMFPTGMRSTTFNIVSSFSRLGSVFSPFIGQCSGFTPVIILGSLGILAAVSVLMLPEMRHKPFPEKLSDMSKHHSVICRCIEQHPPEKMEPANC